MACAATSIHPVKHSHPKRRAGVGDGKHAMSDKNKIILYTAADGNVSVFVRFENETFWLTQKTIAELFNVERSVITKHLANIFADGELEKDATCAKFAHVQTEGGREISRMVEFYNLDAIIAVGYRVNSRQATRFRQWATKTLREFIQKGFLLNDDLLKNGTPFGKDYFDELLERIREIRASERRAYQKIADVFEQCSCDYDPNDELTREFYSFVQNKLHFAITGKTAAELIVERANSGHPTMGLTTWKSAPDGKITRRDIVVAKNYLNQKELSRLNRIVTMFIDYAELMAEDNVPMRMQDWLHETDSFLKNNRRNLLRGKGSVSHQEAVTKAGEVFEQFRIQQDKDYVSNFDKAMARYLTGGESTNPEQKDKS